MNEPVPPIPNPAGEGIGGAVVFTAWTVFEAFQTKD